MDDWLSEKDEPSAGKNLSVLVTCRYAGNVAMYRVLPKDAEIPIDSTISRLAFRLIHKINKITPVTTVSLICNALLSKFSYSLKECVESNVADLMQIIENHKMDALVDRGMPIGESVQRALNLLVQAGIVKFSR